MNFMIGLGAYLLGCAWAGGMAFIAPSPMPLVIVLAAAAAGVILIWVGIVKAEKSAAND